MKNVVITGDSMSYNRYDYDECQRMDATDCFIGMQSWSFRLRNYIITSSKGFRFADELSYNVEPISGSSSDNELDAIFGERVCTLSPSDGVISFNAESDNGMLVLYIQKRPVNYCRFSVKIDGIEQKKKVDTYANTSVFHGFDLMALEFECDKSKTVHEVAFCDFEYADTLPMVTLAGISNEVKNVSITGQGSRTTRFMNYHYEDRIKKYSPDLLVLIIGANDIAFMSAEDYHNNLDALLGKAKKDFPNCRIVTFTLTAECEDKDKIKFFNTSTNELTKKYGGITVDFDKLFSGMDVKDWRFDNVHLNKKGNDMLFEKLRELI